MIMKKRLEFKARVWELATLQQPVLIKYTRLLAGLLLQNLSRNQVALFDVGYNYLYRLIPLETLISYCLDLPKHHVDIDKILLEMTQALDFKQPTTARTKESELRWHCDKVKLTLLHQRRIACQSSLFNDLEDMPWVFTWFAIREHIITEKVLIKMLLFMFVKQGPQQIIAEIFKIFPHYVKEIPLKHLTVSLARLAIQCGGKRAYEKLPLEMKKMEELQMVLIRYPRRAFLQIGTKRVKEAMPFSYLTLNAKIVLLQVSDNLRDISHEDMKDHPILLETALTTDGRQLEDIPSSLMTPRLVEIAIKAMKEDGSLGLGEILRHIPQIVKENPNYKSLLQIIQG